MGVIRSRSELAERLLVGLETAFGSGDFRVDERLRVEEVWQRSDRAISSARISVRLEDDFDSEEARRRFHPDRRLVVMTDEADFSRRSVLFEGYPPRQSSRWDGRIGEESEEYVFEAEHVFERLSRARESSIYGRQVRNGAIEDGLLADPAKFEGSSTLITALPCVFNPDGVANRAEVPLTVKSPAGQARTVHIFAAEGTPFAAKWTFATALRYLVWFYLLKEGPVHEGNVFAVTDALAAGQAGTADAVSTALRREPVSLVCEATNLVEALGLISAAAGLHITAETSNTAGRPVTELRVWSADDGKLKRLLLARGGRYPDGQPRYSTDGRSASEILSANNTYRGEVAWDHRGIVNNPIVLGDVKRYEMTVSLWPGWIPRDDLDNVASPDRSAAKALALSPAVVEALGPAAEQYAWFRRYHRQGSEFKLDADVSRLWVLNEDGFYDGALYSRNAPFDDYRAFDFSTVADSSVTTQGAWMRRTRRLLPAISTSSDGRRLGVWVEISFDSGVTWQQQSSGVRVLEDRVGVYLDFENPTEIVPNGVNPSVQNLWFALVDQTLRVRVTGVIESDERLMGTFPPDRLASPTLQLNTMIVRRPKSFQFASRAHTTNVLVSSTPALAERDDIEAIASMAESLARANQDRAVRVAPTIPWIETGYAMGDRITEIRGRQLRFATTLGAEARWPAVLERRFVLRDGRYETMLTLGVTGIAGAAV